ncbi:elongation factor P--(R)-beta-lysine ligase [Thalassotalea piscium]
MTESQLPWKLAKLRAGYMRKIRDFFFEKDVVEVETPLLSRGTVTDVHLDAFSTQYQFFSDSSIEHNTSLYLQTSPEFAMKRLLADGYGCSYQICKAFRKEDYGRFHNPEFTILEWYRVGFTLEQLMDEVSELLAVVLGCNPSIRLSYQEAFSQQTGIDPLSSSIQELKAFLSVKGVSDEWVATEEDKDILLQYIFSDYVEPKIGEKAPCFIYDFPYTQAALANISVQDNRVAHRFECYYHGIELANGYNELLDHEELLTRFTRDNETRIKMGKPQMPIDNNFIRAMKKGIPECSGVALGLDRLMMLALNKQQINEVITFGIENA